MTTVRDPLRARAAMALSAVLTACNAVIGIEEPIEIGAPDAELAVDGAPAGSDGQVSPRDAAATSDGSTTDSASLGDAPTTRDVTPGRDGGVQDSAGGGVTDGSGAPPQDAREGIVVDPGFARASCTFSEIAGANADSSPYVSTQGDAKRKMDEIIDLSLTNFVGGVQRILNVRLRGPLTIGKSIVLDPFNYVEYFDVKTARGWGSALATVPGGTLKIENLTGTSFSFTITKVKMGPNPNAVGSFTLDGYGSANPQ